MSVNFAESHKTPFARKVDLLAQQTWGQERAIPLIGQHPKFTGALDRLERLAGARVPVLITGETGTGKELFARALFLVSSIYRRGFVPVNCAQYTNDELMASQLFGHRKGSFTGATDTRAGIFEAADGGTLFLDEIGELSPSAQAVLLRVLGEGEIMAVGFTQPKRIDVRVMAATNRNLLKLARSGMFREDLYFRIQILKVRIPPLRERGDDWELIVDYYLQRLSDEFRRTKRLASETISYLARYDWPGNIREVQACVETGYHMSTRNEIEVRDIIENLEAAARDQQWDSLSGALAADYCARMKRGEANFWQLIYAPFMERDLSRRDVQEVIAEGLARSRGSYKALLAHFGVIESEYGKFMDFLRHHRLKPDWGSRLPHRTRASFGTWRLE